MKKTFIITVACLLFIISANAQFKKGTLMVGTTIGSSAYSNANSDYSYDNGNTRSTNTHTYTIGLGPQLGVFLTPSIIVGSTVSLNFSSSHVSTTNNNTNNASTGSKTTTNTTTVSLGPFIRYYFVNPVAKNWFYVQANGAVGTGTGNSSGSGYTATNTNTSSGKVNNIFNWNAGASLGMTHFFYKRIGMDVAVGYNYSHAHNNNTNNTYTTNKNSGSINATTNNYLLNTGTNGITLSAGFHWFL